MKNRNIKNLNQALFFLNMLSKFSLKKSIKNISPHFFPSSAEMDELTRKRKSKDDPSPPATPNLDIFNCFNQSNPSPLTMFSPQFLANQTAAAVALMTWPIQLRAQLASAIRLPNHPLMNWPPPDLNKLNKVFKSQNSETPIVSTTSDLPPQKKIAKRKQQPENIRKLEPLKISEKFVPTILSPTESNSEISTCSSNSKETTKVG